VPFLLLLLCSASISLSLPWVNPRRRSDWPAHPELLPVLLREPPSFHTLDHSNRIYSHGKYQHPALNGRATAVLLVIAAAAATPPSIEIIQGEGSGPPVNPRTVPGLLNFVRRPQREEREREPSTPNRDLDLEFHRTRSAHQAASAIQTASPAATAPW
jgi:hypothetical protein